MNEAILHDWIYRLAWRILLAHEVLANLAEKKYRDKITAGKGAETPRPPKLTGLEGGTACLKRILPLDQEKSMSVVLSTETHLTETQGELSPTTFGVE